MFEQYQSRLCPYCMLALTFLSLALVTLLVFVPTNIVGAVIRAATYAILAVLSYRAAVAVRRQLVLQLSLRLRWLTRFDVISGISWPLSLFARLIEKLRRCGAGSVKMSSILAGLGRCTPASAQCPGPLVSVVGAAAVAVERRSWRTRMPTS